MTPTTPRTHHAQPESGVGGAGGLGRGGVKGVRLDPELPVVEGSAFVDSEGLRPVGRLWGSAYTLLGEIRVLPRPEV